jgi:hypothetical protein
MQTNGASQLIFGPLPQSTYEAAAPISVDTTNHHNVTQHHRQPGHWRASEGPKIGANTRSQSYDRDLQRQRCKFLQRHG